MDGAFCEFSEKFISRNKHIDSFRANDFSRLNSMVYLDHAGATLYPKSLITSYHDDLCKQVYGNPHSSSECSRLTTDTVEQVRTRILQHFHVTPEDYSVIFTSGCTHALKIVGEGFNFSGYHTCSDQKNSVTTDHRNNTLLVRGCLCYLEDNHTSVIGLREIAKSRGAKVTCVTSEYVTNLFRYRKDNSCDGLKQIYPIQENTLHCVPTNGGGNCLFVYPAQSNFSGTKYPLSWIPKIQEHAADFNGVVGCCQSLVLLDAAAFVSTSDLDLNSCRPDFVTLSFYKMFGFPTGLGALLVRNDKHHLLQKAYFGGGTVDVAVATEDFHVKARRISDRFEDGTISFLDIIALKHGFDALEKIAGNMIETSEHTFQLTRFIHHCLRDLRHANDRPVIQLYCDTEFEDETKQGPILNFNVMNPDGEFIGFSEVEKLAHVYNVQFRVGCFCNLGACHRHLRIHADQAKEHFKAGHVCGDGMDLINGKPTGSLRISLGYSSTLADAQNFVIFIKQCFVHHFEGRPNAINEKDSGKTHIVDCSIVSKVEKMRESRNAENPEIAELGDKRDGKKSIQESPAVLTEDKMYSPIVKDMVLTQVFIYPVKSCAAVQMKSCQIGPCGLTYDRQWMVVTETGNCLTQKREPLMCRLQPEIDWENEYLILSYPGMSDVTVPLALKEENLEKQAKLCASRVCMDRVQGMDCGEFVSDWLQRALNRPGLRLIRRAQQYTDTPKKRDKLSLANEAQYLLINQASVRSLASQVREHTSEDNPFADENKLMGQFRANLVISTPQPYEEETWEVLSIGEQMFRVEKACQRCQMICVDQESGARSKDPLLSLLTSRNRRASFGILLHHVIRKEESSSSHGKAESLNSITQGEAVQVIKLK